MLEEGRCLLGRIVKSFILFFLFFIVLSSFKKDVTYFDKVLLFLEEFETLSAEFTQISSKGDIENGFLYINKPLKLRVDYHKPVDQSIVSDGKKLAVIKKKIPDISIYKFNEIPFKVFLEKSFSLEDYSIIKFNDKENKLMIHLKYKGNQGLGSIKIIFEKVPFILKKWIIFDASNNITEIALENVVVNRPLEPNLFKIIDPRKIPFGRKD